MKLAASLLVFCLFVAASHAAQVVAFGDSWGSFSQREFQDMFTSRGYNIKVDNDAIAGTTAKFWSLMPNSLRDAVAKNSDAKWVWLSLGGNDGINELSAGRDIEDVVADVVNNTKKILDPLFRDFPNVRVVQFGYDIVNFEQSITCRNLGNNIFPDCKGEVACLNQGMYNLQYAVEEIGKFYKNFDVIDLRGTLQKASGEVPAPFPNDNYYSPESLMRDCIHPNSKGFDAVFDEFWNVYWSKVVSTSIPK